MKKTVLGLVLSLVWVVSVAQNKSVIIPSAVLHSFTAMYPEIRDVQWKYDEPNYQANFKMKDQSFTLSFDEMGDIHQVRNEVHIFELPTPVKGYVGAKYNGWRIEKANHVDVNGSIYYEALLRKETELLTLVFDRAGGLMMSVKQ